MADEAPPPDMDEAPPPDMDEAPPPDMDEAPPGATPEAPQPVIEESVRDGYLPLPETTTERLPGASRTVATPEPDIMPTKAPAHPWERQVGETIRSYRAFEVYRSMDPEDRSLKVMSEIVTERKMPDGTVKRRRPYRWAVITDWSRKNAWVARANAWDTEVARRSSNKQLRDAAKMNDRHRDLAMLMQSKISQRLAAIKPEELGRRDIDRWLKTAILVERQARGVDRVGSAGDGPSSNFNVNVGVGVGINGQQPRQNQNDIDSPDDTPIGEYLMKNPGDVASAVGSIHELLELVGSGESEAKAP